MKLDKYFLSFGLTIILLLVGITRFTVPPPGILSFGFEQCTKIGLSRCLEFEFVVTFLFYLGFVACLAGILISLFDHEKDKITKYLLWTAATLVFLLVVNFVRNFC